MFLPSFLALTQVMFVTEKGWNKGPLDEEINRKLEMLDNSIDHQHQVLHVKDVKFVSRYSAYIIYEIVENNHPSLENCRQ